MAAFSPFLALEREAAAVAQMNFGAGTGHVAK
jgi:hypothetical protein